MTPLARVLAQIDQNVPIVSVEGEIDIANVAELRDNILEYAANTVSGLVLDLSPTTYLDSQGVHLLIDLADRFRRRPLRFAVIAPEGSLVRRVIELSQVNTIIPLASERAGALTRLLD